MNVGNTNGPALCIEFVQGGIRVGEALQIIAQDSEEAEVGVVKLNETPQRLFGAGLQQPAIVRIERGFGQDQVQLFFRYF